jgi:hypothetical protein
MRTFPAARKQAHPLAFEIENVYASPRAIARVLTGVDGVSDVNLGGRFGSSNDIRVQFKYRDRDYVVWEPYGDNSRYWIGPKNLDDASVDIAQLEDAFKRYRPPFYRAFLGDLVTLRLLKRQDNR